MCQKDAGKIQEYYILFNYLLQKWKGCYSWLEGRIMATYIIMGKFTIQEIKNVKETTKRADRFKEIAAR